MRFSWNYSFRYGLGFRGGGSVCKSRRGRQERWPTNQHVVLTRPAEVIEEAIWEDFMVGDIVDASLVLEWSWVHH